MNVDNGVKVYRYDGSGPIATMTDRAPLYEAAFLPAPAALYADRGASPASKQRAKLTAAPLEAAKKAYVPPGARGGAGPSGGGLAGLMRAEREAELGGSGRAKFGGNAGIPGLAAPAGDSRPLRAPPASLPCERRTTTPDRVVSDDRVYRFESVYAL